LAVFSGIKEYFLCYITISINTRKEASVAEVHEKRHWWEQV
jgi:hypothetical protein